MSTYHPLDAFEPTYLRRQKREKTNLDPNEKSGYGLLAQNRIEEDRE
jgi:hypothetical protein